MTGLSIPPISTSSFDPPMRRPDLQVRMPVMDAYRFSLRATATPPPLAVVPVEVAQYALEVREKSSQERLLVAHRSVDVAVDEHPQRVSQPLALVTLLDAADDGRNVRLHAAQFVGYLRVQLVILQPVLQRPGHCEVAPELPHRNPRCDQRPGHLLGLTRQ